MRDEYVPFRDAVRTTLNYSKLCRFNALCVFDLQEMGITASDLQRLEAALAVIDDAFTLNCFLPRGTSQLANPKDNIYILSNGKERKKEGNDLGSPR